MDTANDLQHFPHVLAQRPAVPGLVVVAGLLIAAAGGLTMNQPPEVWLFLAAVLAVGVAIGTGWQDLRREITLRRHQRRMNIAHGMLADRSEAEAAQSSGALQRLEGLVDEFGRKLDDLLREVHAETAGAGQKQRRS
jgi:hypothetical protein